MFSFCLLLFNFLINWLYLLCMCYNYSCFGLDFQGLSQYHKSLRSLVDHVPHGYRKKFLFEVLIRNNVPLLRATWFIKINYLNQVVNYPFSAKSKKNKLKPIVCWDWIFLDYVNICVQGSYGNYLLNFSSVKSDWLKFVCSRFDF